MKIKTLVTISAIAVVLFSGCAPKTYVSTSPIMAYDLTDVDITTLKSSKVCMDDNNTDVSVRHAAEAAGLKRVYAVDDHIIWKTHLFSAPTVGSRCLIVYGVTSDTNMTEVMVKDVNISDEAVPAIEENVDTISEDENVTVISNEDNATLSEASVIVESADEQKDLAVQGVDQNVSRRSE